MATLKIKEQIRSAISSRSITDTRPLLKSVWGHGAIAAVLWTLLNQFHLRINAVAGIPHTDDFADAMHRWAKLVKVDSLDQVFSKRARDDMTEHAKAITQRLATSNRHQGPRLMKRATFLRFQAAKAAEGQSEDKPLDQRPAEAREIMTLLNEAYFRQEEMLCDMCQFPLTYVTYAGRHPSLAHRRSFPHNLSLDAITPRRRGGKYDAANTQYVCSYCNSMKAGFPRPNALVLLQVLREAKWVLVDGFLQPKEKIPPISRSVADDALIESFVDRKVEHHQHLGRTKDAVRRVVQSVYVGYGKYQDPCGAVLPLGIAEIDKRVPANGYVEDNMRLMLGGET
ncbi:unnamed protein product [Sympodiomycopsis kandeliae]